MNTFPHLNFGDKVALLCPASTMPEADLETAIAFVKSLNLEPMVYPSCYFEHRHGSLAASDSQRASDLQTAFEDPAIKGILCGRGGYGCHRILPLLDFDAVAQHPKYFSGYSDITALHIALQQRCNFITYHTPMPGTEGAEMDAFSLESLKTALFGLPMSRLENPAGQPMTTLQAGTATGTLCGGNLSLIAASLGTPWEIDTQDKLLFLEDIGEQPYRIDAMLTQLRNAGKLDDCVGIILGAWTDITPQPNKPTLTLEEVFSDLLPKSKPILANFACGHVLPTLSLPLGALATVDATHQTLTIL